MLAPISQLLGSRRLILASGSPRRKQILQNIGFVFDVVPSTFEENLSKSAFSEPWQYAVETSRGKALEVAERLQEQQDWAVITGADTIVVLDGEILGKPGTDDNARSMLKKLSGRTHTVHTGVTLVWREGRGGGGGGRLRQDCFHVGTDVTFAKLTPELIESYVQSQEPLDKAGGYGIQGLGGTLVEGVSGDYFNVVGLPLHRLCKELLSVLTRLGSTDSK